MRDIKFRGVHPNTGELMDVCVIDWMHDEVYFTNGTDVAYPIDECKLMQFTGLKDKNGDDIYEGDIVRCTSTHGDTIHINHKAAEVFICAVDGVHFGSVPCRYCCRGKVIGNTHENPELID